MAIKDNKQQKQQTDKANERKAGVWKNGGLTKIGGYLCWLTGIVCLALALPPFHYDIQVRIYLMSFGLAIFAVGTGFICLSTSKKADKRMQVIVKITEDLDGKMEELNAKIQMLMDKQQGE